jgi:O-antigen/teichoic acid export membrane protein
MMFLGMMLVSVIVGIHQNPLVSRFKEITVRIWHEVKNYGQHIYISTIWTDILYHADKLLISYFLSEAEMAYYGLGFILAFPLSHFSTSLSTTLFQRFATINHIGRKAISVNSMFVFLSVLAFILLREPIIVYLFSEEYLPTISVLPPLAIAFGFSGLSKPFTLFLMAQGRGKVVRNISILVPSLQIIINIFVIPSYGISGAAWTACFVYGLDLGFYAAYYHFQFRR